MICGYLWYNVFGALPMKLTITKSKNSEHFYISMSYINANGKSTTKTFKKLGSLAELSEKLHTDRDGVIAWAKEQTRIATEQHKLEQEAVPVPLHPHQLIQKDQRSSFNCGYLFLQSLCSALRFDNIFRNISARHQFSYPIQSVFSDLVYERIIHPSSKKSSFEFAHSLLEKPKYDLHHVYKALSVLASESDYIQSELYKNSTFIHSRNTRILYYDCTNYYFEIEQDDALRRYGKSKEHRPNPIVTMGLFMDSDGIPLAFDVFPGNLNEQKTLKPLEQKIIRDFGCSEFIYCSDAGLGSQNNKSFNDMQNRSYVITQSLKKLKKEDRETALNPKGYRKAGSTKLIDLSELDESDPEVFNSVYYKEVPLESRLVSETLIVTYSPKYRAYQEAVREKQLGRALKMVQASGSVRKERRNPNDPARFIKKTAITDQGEIAGRTLYEIDDEAIAAEAMYDGFYAVTTDIEGSAEEIIRINRRRWQIEECFRIMKTEFEARPVYVRREDRIKAHFLVCFTALLIYRLLERKLENKYTAEEIIHTLRDMNVCFLDGYGYIPTYTRTQLTDDLHSIFNFRTDTQIIKKAKMRSIIHQTKTK